MAAHEITLSDTCKSYATPDNARKVAEKLDWLPSRVRFVVVGTVGGRWTPVFFFGADDLQLAVYTASRGYMTIG